MGSILGIVFLFVIVQLSKSTPPTVPPRRQLGRSSAPTWRWRRSGKADAILSAAQRDGPKDYAVYPYSLGELAQLAGRYARSARTAGPVIDGARKNVVADADRLARELEIQLRPRLLSARGQGDVYLMREIYREFPRPFLEITDTGRAIAAEMRDNEERVAKRIDADLESIPRLIDADEFDVVRERLKRLGNVVPSERHKQVSELIEQTAAAEAERRLQLIPRLLGQVAELDKLVASLLERRQSDEAWNAILGFVESHPPTKLAASLVRIGAIPTTSLRSVVPSTVTEEEIESLLGRFDVEGLAKDEDLPSHRVRWLCEDVLRREWLRRRADRGIQRLVGVEVTLHTFGGAKGKIAAGTPPTLQTGTGPAMQVVVDLLEPGDQIFFAAAAAVGPDNAVETVFKSAEHRRFALAAAAAHRYSPSPGRFSEALRWTEQGRALGLRVPAGRIAALEEAARLERDQVARDMLGKALDHAAGLRFDKAHEELDRAVKEHEDRAYFPLLEAVARDLRARFLLAEAEEEAKGSRWTKAPRGARKLRSGFPAYAPDRSTPLFYRVWRCSTPARGAVAGHAERREQDVDVGREDDGDAPAGAAGGGPDRAHGRGRIPSALSRATEDRRRHGDPGPDPRQPDPVDVRGGIPLRREGAGGGPAPVSREIDEPRRGGDAPRRPLGDGRGRRPEAGAGGAGVVRDRDRLRRHGDGLLLRAAGIAAGRGHAPGRAGSEGGIRLVGERGHDVRGYPGERRQALVETVVVVSHQSAVCSRVDSRQSSDRRRPTGGATADC